MKGHKLFEGKGSTRKLGERQGNYRNLEGNREEMRKGRIKKGEGTLFRGQEVGEEIRRGQEVNKEDNSKRNV